MSTIREIPYPKRCSTMFRVILQMTRASFLSCTFSHVDLNKSLQTENRSGLSALSSAIVLHLIRLASVTPACCFRYGVCAHLDSDISSVLAIYGDQLEASLNG